MSRFAAGLLAGVAATLLVLAAAGLILVYSGAYNVAATAGHADPVRWALETTMENSVRDRAEGLTAPAATAGSTAGANLFYKTCVDCHGAPGVEPSEWARGMVPQPPDLARAADRWTTAEIFWIVKHGIKMTGMPPFGPDHDDAAIWDVAVFVKDRLPKLAEEQAGAGAGPDGGGG